MDTIQFLRDNPNMFLMVVALFSLIIGSFLNVVIYRLPRMIERDWQEECRTYLGLKSDGKDDVSLSLSLPASHCPNCKTPLKAWHNIPVISYLVLRGRCAYCHAQIPIRYPIVELLTCLTSIYVAMHFGFSWQTLSALFFTWILIALTFIDLDFHLLPDQLTFSLLGIGLFSSIYLLFCSSQEAILGAIVGYLIFAITQTLFHWVTGKIGMGEGDYKLLAGLGAFLGWQSLPLIILLASISGIIIGVTHMAIKREFKSVPLPFGPYLAIAGWISLFWGCDIMRLYLHAIQ